MAGDQLVETLNALSAASSAYAAQLRKTRDTKPFHGVEWNKYDGAQADAEDASDGFIDAASIRILAEVQGALAGLQTVSANMTAKAASIAADEKRLGDAVGVAQNLLQLAGTLVGPAGFSVDALVALTGKINASLG